MLSPGTLPFAIMIQEREPIQWADFPRMLVSWVQDVGGFAAAGLAIWVIAYLLGPRRSGQERAPVVVRILVTGGIVGAALAYGLYALISFTKLLKLDAAQQSTILTTASVFALVAAGSPFLHELFVLRLRRILAMATLSFKEAVHGKILWLFSILLLIFLFADWFLPHKPEDQLRTYVSAVYDAMTPLLLVPAGILAAFAIPTDIRNQTIHTVVTKPVQRFEIVFGRFLGYTALMTVVLAVMTFLSLLYVWLYGVNPEAKQESLRARIPLYGKLRIEGKAAGQAKEWGYRTWIPGGPNSRSLAVWEYDRLPGRLDERSTVPCEFSFDILRTYSPRSQQGRGIACTFTFETSKWSPALQGDYQQARQAEKRKANPPTEAEIDNLLAEKFGYWEYPSKEIFNNRTEIIQVPVGLFKNIQGDATGKFAIRVKCEDDRQLLGVATHDLYLLEAEGFFFLNFFKGAVGLWCRICLLIGLAVACSTYLSSVISLLKAMFIYGAGMFTPFIQELALGKSVGGGPAEAARRIYNRQNPIAPLEVTPAGYVADMFDAGFRVFLKRFLNLIPDVELFDLSRYVAEGFDISLPDLSIRLVVLFAYLLPWAVLAYYLMRSREVAA